MIVNRPTQEQIDFTFNQLTNLMVEKAETLEYPQYINLHQLLEHQVFSPVSNYLRVSDEFRVEFIKTLVEMNIEGIELFSNNPQKPYDQLVIVLLPVSGNTRAQQLFPLKYTSTLAFLIETVQHHEDTFLSKAANEYHHTYKNRTEMWSANTVKSIKNYDHSDLNLDTLIMLTIRGIQIAKGLSDGTDPLLDTAILSGVEFLKENGLIVHLSTLTDITLVFQTFGNYVKVS